MKPKGLRKILTESIAKHEFMQTMDSGWNPSEMLIINPLNVTSAVSVRGNILTRSWKHIVRLHSQPSHNPNQRLARNNRSGTFQW